MTDVTIVVIANSMRSNATVTLRSSGGAYGPRAQKRF